MIDLRATRELLDEADRFVGPDGVIGLSQFNGLTLQVQLPFTRFVERFSGQPVQCTGDNYRVVRGGIEYVAVDTVGGLAVPKIVLLGAGGEHERAAV